MVDHTLPLLLDGYLHLTRVRESAGRDTVALRLLGRRATTMVGPEATKLFYDGSAFDRRGVMPPNVKLSLFGDAAVHLLDGPAHHVRKAFFLDVLGTEGSRSLVEIVSAAWDRAADSWRGREVVLFDEAAELLARAAHEWAGVPLPEGTERRTSADLVAMVDGFGSLWPRFAAGRLARRRQERRVEDLVAQVRSGARTVPPGSPFARAVAHQDVDGSPLDAHTVAVEMLNLLRPTTAIAWFVTYAAHALHQRPDERTALVGSGDRSHALAFAHEVRRFYPFAPLLAARAKRDVLLDGVTIPAGSLGVLDVFGQNHHPDLWADPWSFSSDRFVERPPGMFDLVPQGGGDPASGHRCPGEPATVQILAALAPRIATLDATWPRQDLRVTRRRLPARVHSGVVLQVH